eukprot:maker-scaffold1150_size58936-snap-gene-0.13 protein:Tk05050 transcript:maker-scaffold1150_size58936-snap-gene-0.13-mRNA-1 annotation:"unknown"
MPRGRLRQPPTGDVPKGRMTPYAFFVQLCRDEHRRVHPDENVVFAEFSRKCADRWKTMSEREKKRFHQMAEADEKRYQLEMTAYESGRDVAARRGLHARKRQELAFGATADTAEPAGAKKRKKRKKKDPNAPKRAMSAFFWFSQDERAKVRAANPDFGVGDTAKELSRRWAETAPEIRSKFESLAEKDRARYDRDKREYQKTLLMGQVVEVTVAEPRPAPNPEQVQEPDDSIEDPEEEIEPVEEESE